MKFDKRYSMNKKQSRFSHKQAEKSYLAYSNDDLQSLRGWMRKLEQSYGSISSRLLAVENRIALLPRNVFSSSLTEKHHEFNLDTKQMPTDKEIPTDLESNQHILSQLSVITQDIIELNEQIANYQHQLYTIESEKKQLHDQLGLLETEYKKHAFVMKFHGREIPLEITGIIGGILAFLIAGLFLFGGKEIAMSPLFLGFIGCVLIGSSVFRSFHKHSLLKSVIQRKNLKQGS